MISLVPLCTMTITLDRAVSAPTGWFTMTADGLMLPDVRLAIQTHDRAVILVRYSGLRTVEYEFFELT